MIREENILDFVKCLRSQGGGGAKVWGSMRKGWVWKSPLPPKKKCEIILFEQPLFCLCLFLCVCVSTLYATVLSYNIVNPYHKHGHRPSIWVTFIPHWSNIVFPMITHLLIPISYITPAFLRMSLRWFILVINDGVLWVRETFNDKDDEKSAHNQLSDSDPTFGHNQG